MVIVILHIDTRAHHVVVKGRPVVFCHKDRLYEETDLIDVVPEELGDFHLATAVGGHNDGNVYIAVGIGIALAVGTIHHDLRFYVETRGYDLLVAPDETESLVAG